MSEVELLTVTADDGRDLLAAAEADWSRPIPHCPQWNAGQLVGHMGEILAWMGTVVSTGERVSRRDRELAPADLGQLANWYSDQLRHTLDVLITADPDSPTWTFSSRGENRARWWQRRLAVELAIHRWDAQQATGAPASGLDGDVAAAGIEEFLIEFLPGLLAQESVTGLSGSLHLHATDGASEWSIDLDAGAEAIAAAGHAKADTAVRGTRSDLLLWLTGRAAPDRLEVFGRTEVAASWEQLRR